MSLSDCERIDVFFWGRLVDGDHPLNDYLLDGVSKVTGESQRDKLYPMVLDLVRNDTISN